MTTVTLSKTIKKKGVGFSLYDGADENVPEPIVISANIQEIAWDTKKTLIKIPYPTNVQTDINPDSTFYFVDLKNIEEGVRIRGWLSDSVEISGIVTSGTTTTITDTSQSWDTDRYNNYYVKIHQNPGDSGTADASPGGSNTLSDIDKSWTTNQWVNHTVKIIAGTGVGQVRTIVSNAPTSLTVSPDWTTVLDSDSQYIIYGGFYQTRKISDTTTDTLTVSESFSPVPVSGISYEIIFPAWTQFWILRAMELTGQRLYSFIIGDVSDGGINFNALKTTTKNYWDPPGAALEEIGMIVGPDDTGELTSPLTDVARINITMTLIIGDDIQNQT